ncbi:MAG: hypothetical protein ACXWZ0_19365, partial [Mycobacterium sp.]
MNSSPTPPAAIGSPLSSSTCRRAPAAARPMGTVAPSLSTSSGRTVKMLQPTTVWFGVLGVHDKMSGDDDIEQA